MILYCNYIKKFFVWDGSLGRNLLVRLGMCKIFGIRKINEKNGWQKNCIPFSVYKPVKCTKNQTIFFTDIWFSRTDKI